MDNYGDLKKLTYYNGPNHEEYTEFNNIVVPEDVYNFTKKKVKNIRKCGMAQINTFYYPEKNPIYEIEVESYFNIFEILIDDSIVKTIMFLFIFYVVDLVKMNL